MVFLDSAVRGLVTATRFSVILIRYHFTKRSAAERCTIRGSGQGIHASMTRRHPQSVLEHHHAIPRSRTVADPSITCGHKSQCVSCRFAGWICCTASRQPRLRVRPAVTRGRHWSTTTPSSGPTLLRARPRHRGTTLRVSGRSVRDGSVVQPRCGYRSKSGQQSLAGTTRAPRRHPPLSPCCRLVLHTAARLSVRMAGVCGTDL